MTAAPRQRRSWLSTVKKEKAANSPVRSVARSLTHSAKERTQSVVTKAARARPRPPPPPHRLSKSQMCSAVQK